MEVNQPKERANWRLCQTHNCSANASSTCLTDGVVVCDMCTAVFHYDCDVKIKDGEGFVIHALETLKDLVETMKDKGMKNRIDKIKKDFREEISHIQDNIKVLEGKIARKQIDCSNVDNFVKKTKKLAKNIIESHIYSVYTDYILKLEICGIVSTKLDDSEEMGLHGIRTQFYLETKKKERDFCEYKLKALAREIDAKVGQAKQQSDQKFAAFESRLSQEADSTKSRFEQLEQLMFSKFEQMEKEQSSKLEEVNSRVDRHKKKARKSKKLNEEHKEKLKNNLEEHKQKIDHIENKQEEMRKEIDMANKNTEERQTKQDEKADYLNQKIDELSKESSISMKKIEASIEDTCQKIETSNEELKKDFEIKIEAAKSSLQKDLNKNQEDCNKLIDGYSEEVKASYSELKQQVDTMQENLTPSLLTTEQLQLKDEQFYRDKLGRNIVKDFKERFAITSDIFNQLGHFKYKPEDFSQPIEVKCDKEYVYVGQFVSTTNTLHGIGIRVDCWGNIWEGYWKDGNQNGNGRRIDFAGGYYIGTLREGKLARGTEYRNKGTTYKAYDG